MANVRANTKRHHQKSDSIRHTDENVMYGSPKSRDGTVHEKGKYVLNLPVGLGGLVDCMLSHGPCSRYQQLVCLVTT